MNRNFAVIQQYSAFQFVNPHVQLGRSLAPIWLLPTLAKDAAYEVAYAFGVPQELCLFAATAAMAIATQSHVDVMRPGGGQMPVSEMLVYVGPSTSGKSLILQKFLEVPDILDSEFKKGFDQTREEHEIRVKLWKRDFHGLLTKLELARSTETELVAELESKVAVCRLARPKPLRLPRWILTEANKNGLLRTSGYWPWISIVSEEGTKTLNELMMDAGFFNTILDGKSIERDTGRSTQRMVDPRSSIVLISHPDALKEVLERHRASTTDNGLLPRMGIYAPFLGSQLSGQIYTVQPKLPKLQAFNARVKELLLASLDAKIDGSFKPMLLKLSPAAEVTWLTYARELKAASLQGACLHRVSAAAVRSADKALRRAARDHAFSGEDGDQISEATMHNAIQIEIGRLGDWCALLGPPPDEPIEEQCARALHKTLYEHLRRGGMTSFPASWLQPRAAVLVRKQPHYDMALAVLASKNMLNEYLIHQSTRKATRIINLNVSAILSVDPSNWIQAEWQLCNPQTIGNMSVRV
jgi:hypothetical protein